MADVGFSLTNSEVMWFLPTGIQIYQSSKDIGKDLRRKRGERIDGKPKCSKEGGNTRLDEGEGDDFISYATENGNGMA